MNQNQSSESIIKSHHNIPNSENVIFIPNTLYKVSAVVSYFDVAAMEEALVNAGPISVSFTVYSDFENYVGGIYKKTSSDVIGSHAVRIVGYGDNAGDYSFVFRPLPTALSFQYCVDSCTRELTNVGCPIRTI